MEYDGIEDLSHSIKSRGLLQPIVVRVVGDKYIIKAGHRRKRALVLAGEVKTRVLVDQREDRPADIVADMLIENGHRKDLNPMEQAFGISRIKDLLWLSNKEVDPEAPEPTLKEIGDYVGRSQPWVSDRLNLLALNAKQQEALRSGRMTIGEGKRLGSLSRGAVRPGAYGKKSAGYFTSHHPLAKQVERRCKALNHKAGGPNYMNIGCCKCWEHIIRQDALAVARTAANTHGHCEVCGSQVEGGSSDETGSSKKDEEWIESAPDSEGRK